MKQCLLAQGKKGQGGQAALAVMRFASGDGVALEGSFRGGVKQEVLRSLCQVCNATSLALEVSLVPVADADWQQIGSATSTAQHAPSDLVRQFTISKVRVSVSHCSSAYVR